jgi:hypothetical protein
MFFTIPTLVFSVKHLLQVFYPKQIKLSEQLHNTGNHAFWNFFFISGFFSISFFLPHQAFLIRLFFIISSDFSSSSLPFFTVLRAIHVHCETISIHQYHKIDASAQAKSLLCLSLRLLLSNSYFFLIFSWSVIIIS